MKRLLVIFFTFLLFSQISFAADQAFSQREDVQVFINEMVNKHGFDQQELEQVFNQVEVSQQILDSISNPKEAKPWYHYEKFFLTDRRTKEGLDFWAEHEDTLNDVANQYGVPANVIVAILGIETYYGKHQGKYRVIDALSTLAFEYPPRSPFFRKELAEYLLMTKENAFDVNQFYGSYAGAMGFPQFMPSSYRYYAIDYEGNNSKDLQNNPKDAMASVANYLRKNGWQPGQHVATPAVIKGHKYKNLETHRKPYKPKHTLQEFADNGVMPNIRLEEMTGDDKAILVAFKKRNNKFDYWLGYQNFYAITRYNPSANYAMAVYRLSEDLAQQRAKN